MVAAATVLLSSCGGSKKVDTTATEETSTEVKSEAKTLEGLPFDTQKVMADAKGLLFVTNQFDDATISYATVDVNEDGVNEVIFRCAHANNTIDYVIMQYEKDAKTVAGSVMTPGVTEMEESVMKEYVAAHQDITWVGEDTKWLAWE